MLLELFIFEFETIEFDFEFESHIKPQLTKNYSSQGAKYFTHERCYIGHFLGTKDLYLGHL